MQDLGGDIRRAGSLLLSLMIRATAAGPSGCLALLEACPCQSAHSEMDVQQLALGPWRQATSTTYLFPIYIEADVAFCWCLCPPGSLTWSISGVSLTAERARGASATSVCLHGALYPGSTCSWQSGDFGVGGASKALSEHTGVPTPKRSWARPVIATH